MQIESALHCKKYTYYFGFGEIAYENAAVETQFIQLIRAVSFSLLLSNFLPF